MHEYVLEKNLFLRTNLKGMQTDANRSFSIILCISHRNYTNLNVLFLGKGLLLFDTVGIITVF